MKKNQFYFILVCTTYSILFSTDLICQKIGLPEVEYFNRRQYGGFMQNWKVTQSIHDLMYFANGDGLLEYDGESWRLYKYTDEPRIRCVKSIGDRIYAGTFDDFGYFKYDSIRGMEYTSLKSQKDQNYLSDVWKIFEWNGKVIFQTTLGIVIVKDDKVETVVHTKSRFYSSFLVNGQLLVSDEERGLLELRGHTLYPISGGELFIKKFVSSIISINESEIIVSTVYNGIYLWDLKSFSQWNVPSHEELKKANVMCGQRYDENQLVFGTLQNGVIITDNEGKILMHIDKDKELVNNAVIDVFVDSEGSVWCALDNGIARIALNSGVTFLSGYYNLGTGYTQEFFKGNWYFGTNQALYKISEEKLYDPLKTRSDFKKVEGTEGQVWVLYKDEDEDELLCGHNMGLYSIRKDGVKLITPSAIKGIWKITPVDGEPDKLICGVYSGIILLKKINGLWQFMRYIEGIRDPARFLEWDQFGRLWISNDQKKVLCIDMDDDFTEVKNIWRLNGTSFGGIVGKYVTKIHNKVIIVAQDGLYTLKAENELSKYTSLNSFFKDGEWPMRIIEDRFKNIWLFYRSKLEVLRYQEDGSYKKINMPFIPLKDKLVTEYESIYIQNEKSMFLGIEEGYAHYQKQEKQNFRKPFNVHIRSFMGQTDSTKHFINQTLNKELKQKIIPKYPYKGNAFEINFAATYYDGSATEYTTKLSGVDNDFLPWSNVSFRQFTSLHEGKYKITIKARNQYNIESKPLVYEFIVLPPWYRGVYAKVIYILLIVTLTLFVILVFNRRIEISRKKEELKQQDLFKEKEEKLTNEALIAEKEMIKLRNEKLREEMLHKEKELANSTMNIIHKNEFLGMVKERLKKIETLPNASKEVGRQVSLLVKNIDKDIDSKSHWDIFEIHLENVHKDFLKRLKEAHPDLSTKENRLCAYIRMGMSSKEIATMLNISSKAVDNMRYMVRQKINLQQGQNLTKYIEQV